MKRLAVLIVLLAILVVPAIASSIPIRIEYFETIDQARVHGTYHSVAGVNGSALNLVDANSSSTYYIIANSSELDSLNIYGTNVLVGGYVRIGSYGSDGAPIMALGDFGYYSGYRGWAANVRYNASGFIVEVVSDTNADGVLEHSITKCNVTVDSGWHIVLLNVTIVRNTTKSGVQVHSLTIDSNACDINVTMLGGSTANDRNATLGVLAGGFDTLKDSGNRVWWSYSLVGNVSFDDFGVYAATTSLAPPPTTTVTITKTYNYTTTVIVNETRTIVKTVPQAPTELSNSGPDWRGIALVGGLVLLLLGFLAISGKR